MRKPAAVRTDTGPAAAFVAVLCALMLAAPLGGAMAGAAEEGEPAEVDRTGYWTADTSDAAPPALTNEFPPGIICLLQPDVCRAEVQELTGPINEVVQETDIPGGPVQPVPPGSMPVGMLGGQERYSSGMRFVLPPLPEGEEFARVELILFEELQPMAVESPGFRRLVRAVIAQAADGFSPDPFLGAIADMATGEEAVFTDQFPGVEACALLEGWDAEENQHQDDRPQADCLLGSTGQHDEEAGTWTFDLTWAAQAWATGETPNEGLVLRSLGPENLEFGDPDYSSNFIMTFADPTEDETKPRLIVETQPEPEPLPPLEDFDDDFGDDDFGDEDDFSDDDEFSDDEFGDDDFGDGTTDPAPSGSSGGGGGFSSAPSGGDGNGGGGASPAPSFADPDEAAEPETSDEPLVAESDPVEGDEEFAADAAAAEPQTQETAQTSDPTTPWFVWLLLPLGASGLWWYGRVADVQPADGAAMARRGGALSRLTEKS